MDNIPGYPPDGLENPPRKAFVEAAKTFKDSGHNELYETYIGLARFLEWALKECVVMEVPTTPVVFFNPEGIQRLTVNGPSKSCNRHDDCEAAIQKVLAANPGMQRHQISLGFHCHSDDCEDCFGC